MTRSPSRDTGKWLGLIAGLGKKAVDGDLKTHDRAEDAALLSSLGELHSRPLYSIADGWSDGPLFLY